MDNPQGRALFCQDSVGRLDRSPTMLIGALLVLAENRTVRTIQYDDEAL